MKRRQNGVVWLAIALLCAGVAGTCRGDELAIQSFNGTGQLTFNTLNDGTNYSYRVEWAPTPGGTWTNFSGAASRLDAIQAAGVGVVTAAVPMCYRVVATVDSPSDMVLIPAGIFVMGDTFAEGAAEELSLHAASISAFYMDRYEVTKAKWDGVYVWATNHAYSFDNAGSGKATNHPVHTVNWYDCVKWCNARSEKEGLTPAYYTDAAQSTVYRSGQVTVQASWVRWSAGGYRLPTEAEWEKAARGGLACTRFPWGDTNTISHGRANYNATGGYAYDLSSGAGYHPAYTNGGTPYTSPVGSFLANGYGLYDMAGNVEERCWDGYAGAYSSSPAVDPKGSSSYTYRILRGGSWGGIDRTRCAYRNCNTPDSASTVYGFRCVRGY